MHAQGIERLPAVDEVIVDKYRVVRVIARGGMGIVLEAHHLRLDRSVALKILHPSVRADYETAARFEREARAAARITGPHVARVLDVDNLEDGSPFIVMELLKGVDLAQELARREKLPVDEAVGYMLEACAAMQEAHSLGIVHRDLKPSNLFLCEQGDSRTVKILDFGISKATTGEDVAMTSTHSVLGTPLYMSPEQVRSAKSVDARSDIWSLGVILYELLAGRPPFQERSAMAVGAAIVSEPAPLLTTFRPDVPAGLVDAVMKALQKDPEHRQTTVAEFAAAIAPFGPLQRTPSPPVPSVGGAERSSREVARSGQYLRGVATTLNRTETTDSRKLPWAIAALVLVLVGAGVITLSRSSPQSTEMPAASASAVPAAPEASPAASAEPVVSVAPPPSASAPVAAVVSPNEPNAPRATAPSSHATTPTRESARPAASSPTAAPSPPKAGDGPQKNPDYL